MSVTVHKYPRPVIRLGAALMGACAVLALSGCWGNWGNGNDPPPPTYSLSATVSGLNVSGLVLAVNTTTVSVPAGASTLGLTSSLRSGTTYSVTVQTQPAGETCTVSGGAGTIQSANVSNVAVTCSAQWYSVGGTISGLVSGGMVLTNGSDTLAVNSGALSFTMPAPVAHNSTYAVTLQTQPAGLTCSVSNGAGTMGSASVTNIAVTCSPSTYTVGGTISGLVSGGMVLANGSDTLAVNSGTSSFTMPTPVAYHGTYAVTLQTQPTGLTCSVSNGSGTVGSAPVTNIAVTCSPNTYTVGGTISGLTAGDLTLLDNGGDATSTNATQFTMNTAVAYGNTYAITVQTVPAGLVCRVSNGTGTMGADDVTNVSIACAPNFTLLYSFAGGTGDGATPYHSLIQASDGNFYGTTIYGGANSDGTVFKITPSGIESVLYSFLKGAPYSGLIQGTDGNFYGTTQNEGASSRGTVFQLTPSGTESVLYSFPAGSSDPYTGVIQGGDGNFYGTTGANGASDAGTVFEVTPGGTETVLHAFPKGTGSDGQIPYAGLIQGSDGNFYGTTHDGGANGFGTVFKVTPSGTETVLYSFAGGSDGEHPYAGVIQGSDGNFYGTTYDGGANGFGTVFELTPGGTETILHSFTGNTSDGANPQAGLTQGSDGNFYGATYLGGADDLGTIFELTPSGTETVLHSFIGSDGAKPSANLVQGRDGNLYGSATAGGASSDGTFFKFTLP